MTSEEIQQTRHDAACNPDIDTELVKLVALLEIAYQLAIANEREQRRDETPMRLAEEAAEQRRALERERGIRPVPEVER